MKTNFKQASVLKMPAVVPYYGPRPAWITSANPMFITVGTGQFRARDGRTIEVPEGYVTDFASTPRILWTVMPPHGGLMLASLPHDWGYSHGGKSGFLPKAWWDSLFYDLLKITPGVPSWKRPIAYWSVRMAGEGGWKNGWYCFEPGVVSDWSALGGSQ
ncbi:DUF1353 domain-containing protein [Vreelandella alkaliphila]|uniref:DUF1353 domain-containing protein n=1 Tax=Vreelandella alkaliphila TaxID=272774 RepID=A0AAJ2S496_9GAMM|nr:DUF1353 domain-containing protein [Halomonas alkaliphila]MDX5979606.1 DUF1353 domain-containing protein [Halomonas alkaliphila]